MHLYVPITNVQYVGCIPQPQCMYDVTNAVLDYKMHKLAGIADVKTQDHIYI